MKDKEINENPLIINAVTPTIMQHSDHIDTDSYTCAVLNFNEFQSENDIGWADAILDEKDSVVCFRLNPASSHQIKESVDQHTKQTVNSLYEPNKTASQINDLEREQKHGYKILDLLGDKNEKFFMCSIYSVLRASTYEKLESRLAYFNSSVQSAGMGFRHISWNQLNGYFAASPLRTEDKTGVSQTERPFPASTIAHTLFTREPGLDDGIGISLGYDDQDGIVRLNIIERTDSRHNSNIVILGGSGSGKSTLAKKFALKEYLLYGSKVIIFDPETEFSDEVRALGGKVIKVGGRSTVKISPLQPRAINFNFKDEQNDSFEDVDEEENALEDFVLSSTIPFTKSFLKLAFHIDNNHLDYLENALEIAYANYGITPDTTFGEYYEKQLSYPVITDVYNVCLSIAEKDPINSDIYNRIAMNLRSAAIGVNKHIWNERTTLEIDSDLVCFNTEGLEEDEASKVAWYYNIMTWAWSEARVAPKTEKPIRIIFDEAHNVINPRYPDIAAMLKSMVKRIRKRGGGTTIITQEINDLLSDSVRFYGAAILNNATYKFIGQAEAENIHELAKLYGMEQELINRIKKAKKGNFALFAGVADRTWVKVEIEDWEMEMFGKGGGK